MKKYLGSSWFIIAGCFVLWRLALWVIERFISPQIPLRTGFLGPGPWANFDGVHYLFIANNGYHQYLEAFFPLYPMLIRFFSQLAQLPPYWVGMGISQVAFLAGLGIVYLIGKKQVGTTSALWSIMLLLVFPTSFFFAAVYTESLFLLLAAASIWQAQSNRWFLAGLFASLAASVRLFGLFLMAYLIIEYFSRTKKYRLRDIIGIAMVPLGLLAYMGYLAKSTGDALAFFHVQPAFGANRSGNEVILLPQVLWRYLKIFMTADMTTFAYWVAGFEFIVFAIGIALIIWAWREKKYRSLMAYSLLVLLVPTLTGTLSSLPRYILSAFPLFFVLGDFRSRVTKAVTVIMFGLGLVAAASFFIRGYFIS